MRTYVKKEQVTGDANETPERGTELTSSVDQGVVYEEPDIKAQYGMEQIYTNGKPTLFYCEYNSPFIELCHLLEKYIYHNCSYSANF